MRWRIALLSLLPLMSRCDCATPPNDLIYCATSDGCLDDAGSTKPDSGMTDGGPSNPGDAGHVDAGCIPLTCADQGLKCGPGDNGCGVTLLCGSCDAGQLCSTGACVACMTVSDVDFPDDDFIDSNCDGIDGNISDSLFVDPVAGNDTTGTGNIDRPFKTLQHALTAITAQPRHTILVSQGELDETVSWTAPLSVYGGYNASAGWQRSNSRPFLDGGAIAVSVHGFTRPVVLDHFTVHSADASDSGISCALELTDVQMDLRHLMLSSGFGGPGEAVGVPARALDGLPGANGKPGLTTADGGAPQLPTEEGVGSADGGVSSCSVNYAGGFGAPSGASAGGAGQPGSDGGAPGLSAGGPMTACAMEVTNTPATDGAAGNDGVSGGAGLTGSGGNGRPSLLAGAIVGIDGAPGAVGGPGRPGFGGGGGGSFNASDQVSSGGSGAAGGSGGCGGQGGFGGRGGGPSVALLLVGSTVSVTDVALQTAGGGAGADGGVGGNGGRGGVGGVGGPGTFACAGHRSGNGGDGGTGDAEASGRIPARAAQEGRATACGASDGGIFDGGIVSTGLGDAGAPGQPGGQGGEETAVRDCTP